jgi:gamma-glutamyltranspeptidase/glutathione hydrolase
MTGFSFVLRKQEAVASNGMVTSNHLLGSLAGVEILSQGGNAVDAAVATLCALTVVEPMMVSIFGCGFMVLRLNESNEIVTIDNMGVAPEAATEQLYAPLPWKPGQDLFETVDRRNTVGHLSVAVPGSMKAWDHVVQRYGRLSLDEVMQPAIRYAHDGFKASPYLIWCITSCRPDLSRYLASAAVFLPDGKPPKPGQLIRRLDYAKTLETIAEKGSDVLYHGDLARAVINDIQEQGGIMTMSDLNRYQFMYREPARGIYRDRYEIISMAPVSSGGIHLIQMLNMLESFDVSSLGFGSPHYLHLLAEILKLVFADRQQYMGDPALVPVPARGLINKRYALTRLKQLNLKQAQIFHPGDPFLYESNTQNTTHMCVVDAERNIVSATQSLNQLFGSRVTTPGTGMLLNNYMALFDPRPGQANSVSGNKRILSSNAPCIVLRDDAPFLCLGTPGGTRIFAAVCQGLVNVIDFNMTIQEAVEAPRIWTMGLQNTPGEKLNIESGFPSAAYDGLRERGHELLRVPRIAGGMNGIIINQNTGQLHGGACWRADGAPLGFSGGAAHLYWDK